MVAIVKEPPPHQENLRLSEEGKPKIFYPLPQRGEEKEGRPNLCSPDLETRGGH